jgi:hypothetical protein
MISYVKENPFTTASEAHSGSRFGASSQTARRRLFSAGLKARHAAVKEIPTVAHRAARLDFARTQGRENEDVWRRVMFIDEKTFSSSSSGPMVVYRPRNTRYDPQYVKNGKEGVVSQFTPGSGYVPMVQECAGESTAIGTGRSTFTS